MAVTITRNIRRENAKCVICNHKNIKWLESVTGFKNTHVFPRLKTSKLIELLRSENLSFKSFSTKHFIGIKSKDGNIYLSTKLRFEEFDQDFFHYIRNQLEHNNILPESSWKEIGKAFIRLWAAENGKKYEDMRNRFLIQTYDKYQHVMSRLLKGENISELAGKEDFSYIIKSTKGHLTELLIINALFSKENRPISLLDMGTDIGMFPALAYKYLKACGYNPDVTTADIEKSGSFMFLHDYYEKEGTKIKFKPLNLLDIAMYKKAHDVVIMNQVIEHFTEQNYIRILRNVIQNNCHKVLFVTVPFEGLKPTWGHKSIFDAVRLREISNLFPGARNLSENIIGFNNQPLIQNGFLILVKDEDLYNSFFQNKTHIKTLLPKGLK